MSIPAATEGVSPHRDLKDKANVLASGWLLTWLAVNVPVLPIRLLLKNHLHASAFQISLFGLVTSVAWYLKPVAGLVSDSFPLLGTRRRHYLLVGSLTGGVAWLAIIFLPQKYWPLLWALVLMNLAVMVCSTVLGGLLVETGKAHNATGRLTSHRTMMMNISTLVASPFGGYLAGKAFGWTAGVGAVFMFCLAPVVWRRLQEPVHRIRNTEVWRDTGKQLIVMVKSWPLWCAVVMNILVVISPGFTTPLTFYQQGTLHFSDQFLGWIGFDSSLAALIGAALYLKICRRYQLRPIMYAAIILSAAGSFLYLGYRSHLLALIIEGSNGLMSVLATVALFDLSARAAPKGCEALAYSLMMAAGNLASAISDIWGSWMYDAKHWPFMSLVWLNGGSTLLALIAVPFLPKALMDKTDGE